MKKSNNKTKLVKTILKENKLNKKDEKDLEDLLLKEPILINIDKEEDKNITIGDKIADKV